MYKITDSYLSYCEFMQPTTCFPHYAFNLRPQTYLNTVLGLKMLCAYATFFKIIIVVCKLVNAIFKVCN